MKFIRGLYNLPIFTAGTAITIGSFDGVHKGHQQIFTSLVASARAQNLPSVVIIFEPQPAEYFHAPQYAGRLTLLRDKIRLIADYGIDYLVCLSFNQPLAMMSAPDFIQYLTQAFNLRYLLVGDDFHFGYARGGNYALLKQAAIQYGFQLAQTQAINFQEIRVSSTRIRQALQTNDFTLASHLLGRPYTLSGRVRRGDQRGRSIGFPTANIRLPQLKLVLSGVFAVEMCLPNGQVYRGAANVGVRPTVDGVRYLLEVHLLDFNGDLYGQRVILTFRHKLRDEQRFENLAQLTAQIAQDVARVREYFSH